MGDVRKEELVAVGLGGNGDYFYVIPIRSKFASFADFVPSLPPLSSLSSPSFSPPSPTAESMPDFAFFSPTPSFELFDLSKKRAIRKSPLSPSLSISPFYSLYMLRLLGEQIRLATYSFSSDDPVLSPFLPTPRQIESAFGVMVDQFLRFERAGEIEEKDLMQLIDIGMCLMWKE